MVFEMSNPKKSNLVLGMAVIELVVFLLGIGIRLQCLLKVNSTLDNDDVD